VARVRLGSYEFKKKGVSRFDLRDPYHLAVALTWPRFLAALLALYLSVNVVFAARARVHGHPDRPHLRAVLAAAGQVGLRHQSGGGDAQRQNRP
jgi:hypothetical protein